MKTINYLFFLYVSMNTFFMINAQEQIKARNNFDWKTYDVNSDISIDSININILQGNWISTEENFYGDYEIGSKSTKDTNQKILNIKDDKFRNSLSGKFYPFKLNKNMNVFKNSNKPDTAFINKISKNEIWISSKSNLDYVQIIYRK